MTSLDFSIHTDMRSAPGTMPTATDYDAQVSLVKLAEDLGYACAWTSEQHGVDDGYLPAQLVALSAFARETSRIRLGTGAILLPLTQFRRLAEEACVLDLLSHGRLTLGVAAGHHPHEFKAFDVRLEDRAELMERGLEFLRPALTGQVPPDGLPINVAPVQKPVPLIVGGLARPAVERAVRLGDGLFTYSYVDPDQTLTTHWSERIAPAMKRHGKTPATFRLIFTSVIWTGDDAEKEWHEHVGPAFLYQQQRYSDWAGDTELPEGLLRTEENLDGLRQRMLIGTASDIAARLSSIRATYPFHEVVFWPQLPGVPSELAAKAMRTFAEEVAPRVTALS